MSEFQGLHNPDQHRPSWNSVTAWCDCGRFGVQCTTDYPCRCCLAAEVERLTAEYSEAVALGERLLVSAVDWKARAQSAEAEVERLTAELAERDRRIEAALALLHHPTEVNGCMCLAHQIAATLRGECDE